MRKYIILIILILSIGFVKAALIDGMQAYYSFEGNAEDNTTNNEDGTVNGATLNSSGVIGSGYNCDGVNDYISLPFIWRTKDNWTVSFWGKSDGWIVGDNKNNMFMIEDLGTTKGLNIGRMATAGLVETALSDGGTDTYWNTPPQIPYLKAGNWIMYTITHNNVSLANRVFVNGVFNFTFNSALRNDLDGTRFCAYHLSAGNYGSASIDEAGFWNRTLTDNEVYQVYNKTGLLHITYPLADFITYAMTSVNWAGYTPLNNTIWNNDSLTFTFNVTQTNIANMNCSLNMNNTVYTFKSNLSTVGTNTLVYNISATENANYNFNITCYDADVASRTATSTNKYLVIDKIVPAVTLTSPNPANTTKQSYKSNLVITGQCDDTNLYESEINITNSTGLTKYYAYNSSVPSLYIFSNTTDSTTWNIGQYTGVIRCGDNHNPISDASLQPTFEKIDESNIIFENKYTSLSLVATSKDTSIDKSTQILTKEGGYKVSYELLKLSEVKDNDVAFDVTCDGKLDLIDEKTAHFLCGSRFSRLSIDFIDEIKSGAKLNIEKRSDNYYIVHVITDKLIIDPYVGSVNTGYSFFNFSIMNYIPNQPTLNYPADTGTNLPLSVNLNVSVVDTDTDAMTVKFILTNGTTICTNTGVASGTATNCSFNSLEEDKTYTWYANASDGTNNIQSPIWNFTTIRYHYGVNITLTSPSNNTAYAATPQTVAFVFTGIDGVSPFSCSLQLNGTINQTGNFFNNSNSIFLITFYDGGLYDWSINCSDTVFFNSSNNFTLSLAIPVPPTIITIPGENTGGGGGGGGGTGITTTTTQTYSCSLNLDTTYEQITQAGNGEIKICNNNQKNLTYSFEFDDGLKPFCNLGASYISLNPAECYNLAYNCDLLSEAKKVGNLVISTAKYQDDTTVIEPCGSNIAFYLGEVSLLDQYKMYMGGLWLIAPVAAITLLSGLAILLYFYNKT